MNGKYIYMGDKYVLLTAFYLNIAQLTVHGEVLQIHGTGGCDRQPDTEIVKEILFTSCFKELTLTTSTFYPGF